MGLSSTLNIAQSALNTNANLTTVLSKNISGVNNPNYSRKTANVVTDQNGGAVVQSITRQSDTPLFNNMLSANSASASDQALSDGLDQLEQTVSLTSTASDSTGTVTDGNSPATMLGALQDALEQYESAPDNTAAGQAAITAAKALATNLNSASSSVNTLREQADQGMVATVQDMNSLLTQFQTVNTAIINATATGADTSDLLDSRDKILGSLSQDVGISTVASPNGGMSIYTDSGVTLFQGSPRTVSFQPTATYVSGTVGNAVMIDGVPVTGSSAIMPISSGKLAGLATLRDTTTVNYQDQLDQIAGGLITAMANTDQTGSGHPTVPGLFTAAGSSTMPASDAGLAGTITVSAAMDPSQGGNVTALRDGATSSTSPYNANPSGNAAYSGHLTALISNLQANQSFDPSSGGVASGSLATYAASSVSWLETSRQSATDNVTSSSALATQTQSSLNSETGVNLDDQLSQMLDLEHSYQASAELLSTVNSMFSSLFTAMS